jgi:two-component system CitB family sensor kinase
MRLHIKIMIMFSSVLIIVIGVLSVIAFKHIDTTLEDQLSVSTLDMAITVASMTEIKEGLKYHENYEDIQAFIEVFRKDTRYHYIIVMDMNGIQYSYPYTTGIGKPYKNGGETRVLEEGVSYSNYDRNELISAVQGFAPVFHGDEQVGAVLIGLLSDDIQQENVKSRRNLEWMLVFSVCVVIGVAYLLSVSIKRSIFGLEPKEIAMLLSEKELILKSINRGILAIDLKGYVLLNNHVASDLLDLPREAEGENLSKYNEALMTIMQSDILSEADINDSEIIIGGARRLMIKTCLMRNAAQEIVGAIASVEDYSVVMRMAEDITNYKEINDSLRAQNHEFMNKLHTVSGLIQLGNYDEAINYIDNVAKLTQKFSLILKDQIMDSKVAGLLLSKYNILKEAKVEFYIDKSSYLKALPKDLTSDDLCSIIGNIMDNSYQALIHQEDPSIQLLIISDKKECHIDVYNNGPAIEAQKQEDVYEKTFTTKGSGHGMGMAIVKNIIDAHNGTITWENNEGVWWHVTI